MVTKANHFTFEFKMSPGVSLFCWTTYDKAPKHNGLCFFLEIQCHSLNTSFTKVNTTFVLTKIILF